MLTFKKNIKISDWLIVKFTAMTSYQWLSNSMKTIFKYFQNVKKKSIESTMDLSKLYFTGSPVSLELISILSSKDVNQKNEDTVRNGLKSVDLNELNTLVDQLLLYNGVLLKFQVSTIFIWLQSVTHFW